MAPGSRGDGSEADAELTDVQIRQVLSTLGTSQTMFRGPREPAGEPDEANVQRLVEMVFPARRSARRAHCDTQRPRRGVRLASRLKGVGWEIEGNAGC